MRPYNKRDLKEPSYEDILKSLKGKGAPGADIGIPLEETQLKEIEREPLPMPQPELGQRTYNELEKSLKQEGLEIGTTLQRAGRQIVAGVKKLQAYLPRSKHAILNLGRLNFNIGQSLETLLNYITGFVLVITLIIILILWATGRLDVLQQLLGWLGGILSRLINLLNP